MVEGWGGDEGTLRVLDGRQSRRRCILWKTWNVDKRSQIIIDALSAYRFAAGQRPREEECQPVTCVASSPDPFLVCSLSGSELPASQIARI